MDFELRSLFERVKDILVKEPKLIVLPREGKCVFVGDTHGDDTVSKHVINRYMKPKTTFVFLGDYLDRGERSLENLTLLLRTKLEHPDQLYLLQGNHEGWRTLRFSPANFWESLPEGDARFLAQVLSHFPLAAHSENGLIALHGALPDVPALSDINRIDHGSEHWRQITWGDYQDAAGHFLGSVGGRLQFGRDSFEELMVRFGRTVLIRAHQVSVPLYLFEDRCLTLTALESSAKGKRLAVVEMGRELHCIPKLQWDE